MGSVDAVEALPFWQVNCPLQERTAECPAFLLNLSEKDRRIIGTPDVDYTLMPWNQVKELVHENQLQAFQRVPSELRRYRAYTYKLAEQYGSVARFILEQRLRWIAPVVPSGNPPFQDDTDIKILWNDWPYGLDPRIVHLVVWTKFDLASDPETGDLTAQARDEIERFVTMTFRSRVPAENVLWFKNWAALKSIHAVEHFHVMMLDPNPVFVREVTNGDIPQCAKSDV